jgi:hypothetical protein
MSVYEIPEHVLQHAPWSISKAGVIEKCSAQFDLKYGPNKIKELVQYNAATVGVAVHKALELALDGNPVKIAFRHAIDQCGLTTNEAEETMAFYDQIERFVKKMALFQQKHGVLPQNKYIERKWALKHDFTATEFFDKKGFFRGVVDFGMLTAANDLVIIDHKTGKQKELKEYEAQFRSYCLMALAKIPDLRGVQTAVNFVQTDQLVWNKYVTAETIKTEYRPWLIEYLTKSCAGLLKPPIAVKGWYCDWCGYKPICTVHGGTGRVPSETNQ